ncbi:hypothetical protein, partial [Pantoea ananatis]|uniref:hypothetical protein n=1 Tax=Pantoea ananas TaxID=553 RepID=UPI001B316680
LISVVQITSKQERESKTYANSKARMASILQSKKHESIAKRKPYVLPVFSHASPFWCTALHADRIEQPLRQRFQRSGITPETYPWIA